jgi:hypothetical protein
MELTHLLFERSVGGLCFNEIEDDREHPGENQR